MPDPDPPGKNRLARSTSPYLLQHAGNPVDWYPWGPEALEKAAREDKPIFLSIGYSACHWCHVMERESFEDEGIARILNEHFVPVKVDREERPDLDEIYMTAVQMMTGSGGWPMSVWLTPDGRPFYGGTYFPPDNRYGRPGFGQVLQGLAEAWTNRRAEVEEAAAHAAESIRTALAHPAGRDREMADGASPPQDIPELADLAVARQVAGFDPSWGGFGGAPKFPPAMALLLMLRRYEAMRDEEVLAAVTKTLEAMARGGMYDQVGGGFHRYSTDRYWLVPHFEKMLYDQALLVRAYTEGYRVTGNPEYARIARETCEFVLRELTDPAGGFWSTLDADSDGEEGKFYVWTPAEVEEALGADDARVFCETYDITPSGNWEGKSIPRLLRKIPDAEDRRSRLDALRGRLLEVRSRRVRPGLDDKVLASWNGLMIGALARAGSVLGEPRFVEAASRAAGFVLRSLRADGRLLHQWRAGEASGGAFLDDYAALVEGLAELHEATGEASGGPWIAAGLELAGRLLSDYRGPDGGFFLTASDHESLLARPRSVFDNAVASGNSLAIRALLLAGHATGNAEMTRAAAQAIAALGQALERIPGGFPYLLWAALEVPEGVTLGIVSATPLPPADPVAPGGEFRAGVRVRVAQGWHVQALRPLDPKLIATSLEVTSEEPLEVIATEGPEPTRIAAGYSGEPVLVLTGEFEIALRCRIPAGAPPGNRSLTLSLRTQPCDGSRCLAPETRTFEMAVEVMP